MLTKITNIKISVNCSEVSLDTVKNKLTKRCINFQMQPNFVVFNSYNNFFYTIFRSKKETLNHINITGIKTFDGILLSINLLKSIKIVKLKQKTIRIDNITGSLDIEKEVFLKDLITKTQLCKSLLYDITIKYNNETFPGAFFRVKERGEKIGTINIFTSGKAVFVGCRELKNIECLESLILALTCLS